MLKLIIGFTKIHFTKIVESGWGSYISAALVLALMPIYIWYIPPFMASWGIFWVLETRKKEKQISTKNDYFLYLFILFSIFYLWQLFGIIYSEDKKYGINMILSRLSLLFFPLVLFIPGLKIKDNGRWLIRLFSLSTILFIILCFGNALFKSASFIEGDFFFNPHPPEEPWMNYFYGYYFAINQHPSYLAMYVILSGFVAIESFFDFALPNAKRVFWLLIGLLLLVSLYFISSRAGLLALITLLSVYIYLKIEFRRKIVVVFVMSAVLVILFYAIRTNERVSIGINEDSMESFVKKDGRIAIWTSVIYVVQRNLILGVGIGDTKDELLKEYNKAGDHDLISKNYNAHNEYLEILVENGIIGVAIFACVLIFMLFIAFSTRNHLYIIFILMMMIFFLFETVLNRLQGVTFFSIFSFLLLHIKSQKT